MLLQIEDLCVKFCDKPIINRLSLVVKAGEVHALMGPNGAGKSTFFRTLVGDPTFDVTYGRVLYKDQDLLALSSHERACAGLFMSFQNPVEIQGLTTMTFLKETMKALHKARNLPELAPAVFLRRVRELTTGIGLHEDMLKRPLNVGFSGGEKKRMEILQLLLFEPQLILLDEVDSGLDVDALRYVASCLHNLKTKNSSIIVITHYERFLETLIPDFVHAFVRGKIVQSGDLTLAKTLDQKGYDHFMLDTLS